MLLMASSGVNELKHRGAAKSTQRVTSAIDLSFADLIRMMGRVSHGGRDRCWAVTLATVSSFSHSDILAALKGGFEGSNSPALFPYLDNVRLGMETDDAPRTRDQYVVCRRQPF